MVQRRTGGNHNLVWIELGLNVIWGVSQAVLVQGRIYVEDHCDADISGQKSCRGICCAGLEFLMIRRTLMMTNAMGSCKCHSDGFRWWHWKAAWEQVLGDKINWVLENAFSFRIWWANYSNGEVVHIKRMIFFDRASRKFTEKLRSLRKFSRKWPRLPQGP